MKLFPKQCSTCNRGMAEGYLIGYETFCSAECAFSSKEEQKEFDDRWSFINAELEKGNEVPFDNMDDYWTDWCLEDADEAYTAEGIEVDPDEGAKP